MGTIESENEQVPQFHAKSKHARQITMNYEQQSDQKTATIEAS